MRYYLAIPVKEDEKVKATIFDLIKDYGSTQKVSEKHKGLKKLYHKIRDNTVCKTFDVKDIFSNSRKELHHFQGTNYFAYPVSFAIFSRLLRTENKNLKLFFEKVILLRTNHDGYTFVKNKNFI